MMENYLNSAKRQFTYYQSLGDKTFQQLSDEDLFWQYHPDVNSIAVIVQHLWGNMRSRWINFLTEDGEKSWRNRDQEFEAVIQDRTELLTKWDEGWNCVFQALDSIQPPHYQQLVYIRNQGHSLTEAINRQMNHYAYHVGQIVQIGKMCRGAEWVSLSIPKGQSNTFNETHFSKEKKRGHFTDGLL